MKKYTLIEALDKVTSENITYITNLDEYMACKFQDRGYNRDFPQEVKITKLTTAQLELLEIYGYKDIPNKQNITVNSEVAEGAEGAEGEDFEILVYRYKNFKYNRTEIQTSPDVGGTLKRKQKRYPNGVKLTRKMLKESEGYNNFVNTIGNNEKLIRQLQVAIFLVELSNTNYIQEDELAGILLKREYDTLEKQSDKLQFLKDHNFNGLENFNYKGTSTPDGYGHKNVSCMSLDFKCRSCNIIYGNSGD